MFCVLLLAVGWVSNYLLYALSPTRCILCVLLFGLWWVFNYLVYAVSYCLVYVVCPIA